MVFLRVYALFFMTQFFSSCAQYTGPGTLTINFNNASATDLNMSVSLKSENYTYSVPSQDSKKFGHHFLCYECDGCSSGSWTASLFWGGECEIEVSASQLCYAEIDISCDQECVITSNDPEVTVPSRCSFSLLQD